jgi:hypothetical protein
MHSHHYVDIYTPSFYNYYIELICKILLTQLEFLVLYDGLDLVSSFSSLHGRRFFLRITMYGDWTPRIDGGMRNSSNFTIVLVFCVELLPMRHNLVGRVKLSGSGMCQNFYL